MPNTMEIIIPQPQLITVEGWPVMWGTADADVFYIPDEGMSHAVIKGFDLDADTIHSCHGFLLGE